MSTNPAAAHSKRSIILNGEQKRACRDLHTEGILAPNSLIRAPLRFTGDEDRQLYRQAIRTLALVYVGIVVLVVAITALRGEWTRQELTAKATAGVIDIPQRH